MNKDFELRKLSEVCNFQNGFAFKSNTFKDSGTPVIRITNIKNEIIDTSNVVYINPLDYNQDLSKYEIKNNDLLIAMSGATTGKIGIYKGNEKLLLNQRVGNFKPKDKLSKEYLFYFLLTKVEENLAISAGSAQPNLSTLQINNFMLPLFNLDIQKQIVEILDKAFESIEKAKVNIEKNIENTKELFQSRLNEIFSQKGDDWEERKLRNITTKIGSGSTPRGGQSSYKESGISLIRSMNVHDNGFKKDKLAFIDEAQAKKLDNVTIEENDILLNITGASVARCCIAPKDYLPARVNQHVSIIRIKDNILFPKFLHYSLTSKENKDNLLGIGEQGATRQAITKVQIENFVVKFPKDINIQIKLVNELENLNEQTKQLEKHYKQKLKNLEELKKSILQKAFSGELLNDS